MEIAQAKSSPQTAFKGKRVSAGAILRSLEAAACTTACHNDETLARKMPFRVRNPPRSLVSLQLSVSAVLLQRPGNDAEKVNSQFPAKAKIARNLPLLLGIEVPPKRPKLHVCPMHIPCTPTAARVG